MPVPGTWEGRALQQGPMPGFLFFQQGPLFGLLDRREGSAGMKYWQDEASVAHAFDVHADPGETRDLLPSVPAARLAEWRLQLLPVLAQSTETQKR